jgi:hypothetical protein
MIKYIYYRLCKHHEKGKRINISTYDASRFVNLAYFMMLWPFTLLFIALMYNSSNHLPMLLVFILFFILSFYLTNRFEKRMQTYRPPKQYKSYNKISIYWLTIPALLLFIAYFIAVLVLLMEYVIVPYKLGGRLYNLLF